MVICPRCQQPIDETVRTTCPLCSTSIVGATQPVALDAGVPAPGVVPPGGSAPQPVNISTSGAAPLNAPAGNLGISSSQRMSLNGEVFEAPVPLSTPAGNSQYQARSSYGAPRKEVVKEQPRSNSTIVYVFVAVVMVLLAGGGYYYYMNRTTPKEQASRYFAAVKENNYKVIYNTLDVDPAKYKDEKDFVDQSQQANENMNPQLKAMVQSALAGLQFQVGATKTNNGSEATVPVTITGSISITMFGMNKTQEVNMTQDVKMKNFQGIWKVSRDNQMAGAGGLGNMALPGTK